MDLTGQLSNPPEPLASLLSILSRPTARTKNRPTKPKRSGYVVSNGLRLRRAAAATYEAWQVVGGSPQHLIVAVSPGDVSVFDETEPRTFR
jgi:hypothetical protein